MIATILAALAAFFVGLPIARAIDRDAQPALLAGLGFLYGTGAIFIVMLVLSTIGIGASAPSVGAGLLAVFFAATAIALRRGSGVRPSAFKPHAIDLLTILTIAGYALYATLVAPWEIDYWAIWGLKARVFLEAGGIDWRFLQSPWNVFQHPDYPLLVPFNLGFVGLVGEGWDDHALGVLFVAWGASLIAVIRALATREFTPCMAALITFGVAAACLTRFVGLAEGPLVAFGAAAVLCLREALRSDEPGMWRHGAVLLGLAANCKNEGLALLGAVALGLIVCGPRARWISRMKRLWPALAIALPWLILRATHDLPTDLVAGSVVDRVVAHLQQTGRIVLLLLFQLAHPWAWITLIAALFVAPKGCFAAERFVIVVTAVQLAFFVGAYFASPFDVGWHIWASWPRLTAQLMVPLSFCVLAMLARALSAPPETQLRESPA